MVRVRVRVGRVVERGEHDHGAYYLLLTTYYLLLTTYYLLFTTYHGAPEARVRLTLVPLAWLGVGSGLGLGLGLG